MAGVSALGVYDEFRYSNIQRILNGTTSGTGTNTTTTTSSSTTSDTTTNITTTTSSGTTSGTTITTTFSSNSSNASGTTSNAFSSTGSGSSSSASSSDSSNNKFYLIFLVSIILSIVGLMAILVINRKIDKLNLHVNQLLENKDEMVSPTSKIKSSFTEKDQGRKKFENLTLFTKTNPESLNFCPYCGWSLDEKYRCQKLKKI